MGTTMGRKEGAGDELGTKNSNRNRRLGYGSRLYHGNEGFEVCIKIGNMLCRSARNNKRTKPPNKLQSNSNNVFLGEKEKIAVTIAAHCPLKRSLQENSQTEGHPI